MNLLDRYITRQFVLNFIILLSILMALFVLVDFIAGIDEFVQAGRRHADSFGGFVPAMFRAFADYYAPVVIRLFVLIAGLLVVGAMGFCFAAMARQRELVAMLTGGMSLYRVAAPVLLAGIAINLLLLPIQEFVIPPLAPKLVRSKADLKRTAYRQYPLQYLPDEQGSLLTAGRFIPGPGTPSLRDGVSILMRDDQGQATRRISATEAIWDTDARAWRLINGFAVTPTYRPDPLAPTRNTEPISVEIFPTSLTPEAILARRASAYPRLVSIAQLRKLSQNYSVDASMVLRIMHGRYAGVVTNVLLLIIALPFFLVRAPANLSLAAFQAAAVTIAAWGLALVFGFHNPAGLNPVAAAWLPVVILLPIAGLMLSFIES